MLVPPGSKLVFEQFVTSGSGGANGPAAYSDPRFNDWLGRANDLNVFAVADQVTGPVNLLVAASLAADEQLAWYATEVTAVSYTPLSSPGVTIASGGFTDPLNMHAGGPAYRRIMVQMNNSTSPVTARVRVWVAGRSGTRRSHRLLFAERIEGTDSVYTPDVLAHCTGDSDKLALSVFTESASGTGGSPGTNPGLVVQAEESPNGRAWTSVHGSPEMSIPADPGTLSIGAVTNIPTSALLRFRLQLSGTNPAAKIRLWVTERDVRGTSG